MHEFYNVDNVAAWENREKMLTKLVDSGYQRQPLHDWELEHAEVLERALNGCQKSIEALRVKYRLTKWTNRGKEVI